MDTRLCRSIKQLRYPDRAPTDEEINAAARQFVRKISGYRTPSKTNQAAFEQAIAEIAAVSQHLLDNMGKQTTNPRHEGA
jgi:hypothetical protein